VPLQVHGMEVTLKEDVQPIVPRVGGTLLATGPVFDARTVTYSAFDPQSGLAKVEVLLGESVVARRDITPLCHYYDFTVCPAGDEATLSVDTHAVPNGLYPLTIRVYDAAGNQTEVQPPSAIEVANAAAPRPLQQASEYPQADSLWD
jgi:dipeptidyl aminopeptidase/acylaminoacyl peptidase